jgi:hypothetical protein
MKNESIKDYELQNIVLLSKLVVSLRLNAKKAEGALQVGLRQNR